MQALSKIMLRAFIIVGLEENQIADVMEKGHTGLSLRPDISF